MRSLFALFLTASILANGSSSFGDDGVTPYDALLPIENPWDVDGLPYHASLIVDARTGEPIQSALLTGYDEDTDPRRAVYAPKLCEGRSNAEGVAWMKSPGWQEADHWLVQAHGYAPSYHFGYQPPTRVRLVRGVTVAGQLTDVFGEPLAGAQLELFCGCEHGPVFATVTADEEGRVQLPRVNLENTRILCVPERGAARVFSAESLAHAVARGQPFALEPGRTLTGRVFGADAQPLAGATVRLFGGNPPENEEKWRSFRRGPATKTDADGRFVLRGVGEHEGILVAAADGSARTHRRIPPGRNPRLDIAIDEPKPNGKEPETSAIVMRAKHAAGGYLPRFVQHHAIRADGYLNGFGVTPGEQWPLAPGPWHFCPYDPFGPVTFDPFDIVIEQGETLEREVVITQQPRTALVGVDVPIFSLGQFAIATATHGKHENVLRLMEGLVFIPRDEPVVLYSEDWRVLFGPEADGRRSVHVKETIESVIEINAPFEIDTVALEQGGVEVDWPNGEGGKYVTTCRGDLVVRIEDEHDTRWRAPIRIDEPGQVVRIDVAKLAKPERVGVVRLSWRLADGSVPNDVHISHVDLRGDYASNQIRGASSPKDDLEAPCRVRLSAPGLQTLEKTIQPGAHEIVWGPNTLVLEAFSPDGKRVPSTLMVDGQTHRDLGTEPLRLGGLSAGRHRVVVVPMDVRWRGVQMDLDLSTQETRRRIDFTVR